MFYPEELAEADWFSYYCELFNTVELNTTYYRSPRPEALRRLYAMAPADYHFSVKAPWYITQARRLGESQRLAREFSERMLEGLGEKLGTVLFQLPHDYVYDVDRLMWMTEVVDPAVDNVIEFRHPSWWNPEVFSTLRQAGIIFSGVSHPDLPNTVVQTAATIYYRLHGVPYLYNSEYTPQSLEDLAQSIANRRGVRRVCIYFNNAAEGHAVMNARKLQEILLLARNPRMSSFK